VTASRVETTETTLKGRSVTGSFRTVAAAARLNAADWTPRELRHSFVSLMLIGVNFGPGVRGVRVFWTCLAGLEGGEFCVLTRGRQRSLADAHRGHKRGRPAGPRRRHRLRH